jgi:two-component system, OmpR family, alkaline phosphatase synthesis response regulator PhoP
METVLIIEDDPAITIGLKKNLKYEGYEVMTVADGQRGLEMAVDKRPDLIVLDVMLPNMSGFEVCKTLKKNEVDIPIIIISAKDQEIDKIMGLDLGADDYMTKPFSVRELVARINAVLRRKKRYERDIDAFQFGDVAVDFIARTVTKAMKPLDLSPREFDLLAYFIKHPNQVLERRQILNKVWGYDYYGTARTIDNFVTKLRQKVEPDAERPIYLMTVRGIGYKFVPEQTPSSAELEDENDD